ncbi:MAG TPA: hypothetical protein VF841_00095 [Anaeromyxobacter sp.]
MSAVGRSLFVFGWYLAGLGALLVLAPNALLGLFGLAPTDEVWIRVAGVLVLVIAYLDVRMGREDFLPYARFTVHARAGVLVLFVALVLAGLAPPILVLFGAVDLAGALWTAAALRRDPRTATSPPGPPAAT